MEDATVVTMDTYLIVCGNVIVAEDLRDTLTEWGADAVDVVEDLAGDWSDGYAVAFFSAPLDEILHDPRVRSLSRQGTRIVLLGAQVPDTALKAAGLIGLPYPFRSEDVAAVLALLGIPRRR